MSDELLRERQGHIEILTINRPEARNAINLATATALSDAFDEIETDDDVWVVVLTAAGDKAFSAGMDLKAFATGEFPITEKGFGGITKRDFPKVLIAACWPAPAASSGSPSACPRRSPSSWRSPVSRSMPRGPCRSASSTASSPATS